jgi:hypothetical protein
MKKHFNSVALRQATTVQAAENLISDMLCNKGTALAPAKADTGIHPIQALFPQPL